MSGKLPVLSLIIKEHFPLKKKNLFPLFIVEKHMLTLLICYIYLIAN